MAQNKGKNNIDFKLLGRIIRLASPYKKQAFGAVALTLLLAIIAPVRPILIQITLDDYVKVGDEAGLLKMMFWLILVLLIQTLFLFANTYLTNWIGQMVIKDLRTRVFRFLTGLKTKFYDKTPIGTLVTRTVSDIETIANVFSQGVITITGDVLQLVVITIVMIVIDWKLTLVCLSVLPFLIYASNVFRKGVKKAFQQVRNQVSILNTFIQEQITGMSTIQMFNQEDEAFTRFESINKKHLEANKEAIFHYAIFFPIIEIITAVSTALLIWFGAGQSANGIASPGTIVSFILFLGMFFRPIRIIADRFNTLQMGMVGAERVFQVLDQEEQVERSGAYQGDVEGEIEFKNVRFRYTEDKEVLKGVSFKIEKGKTLALVGSTGSGKSTIVNLLTGFYQIEEGDILIDGVPVKKWDYKTLRSQIAYVLQDVFLFSDTILENIRMLDQSIEKADVQLAAKKIGADRFINRLEDGLNHEVMERGSSLSVGQRQLITFIRAMAADPAVLILDEATASIDSETEILIQEATEKMMEGRTSIVIAHRLSTIQKADEILVLDHGEIIERGNHEALMTQNGRYAELISKQKLEIERS
jgi:ATP-binding cassette subfamily B multidrug efflux pump